MDTPPRYLTEQDFKRYIPVHVVWEITLACDLKRMHWWFARGAQTA